MQLYTIRRPSFCADMTELQACGAVSAQVGEAMGGRVRWIRSYVVHEADGRLGTLCVYQAKDVESLREHARRAELPATEIRAVETTVVINPDPVEAREAVPA